MPTKYGEWTREEIAESHSSVLFNRRMDSMFARLDVARIEAWTNICVPTLKEFFAILSGIYNNVFPLFNEDENKEIMKLFDKYYELFEGLGKKENQNYDHCYRILFTLDRIQQLIIAFLQKRQYFMRIKPQEVKGIRNVLELMERRKGVLHERIPGMDEVQHQRPAKD